MFAGDWLCPCDCKETTEEPRDWNKGGGEKTRESHLGVMASAAIHATDRLQETRVESPPRSGTY